MPTHARISGWQHARRLALTSLCAACVGTPTPEPPDYDPLPRPDGGGLMVTVRVTTVGLPEDTVLPPVTVPLTARAGTVAADSEVWLINLDEPTAPPVTLRADAAGGFETMITGRIGQRIRFVYRSDGDHSLPLDLVITGNLTAAGIAPVRESSTLTCLHFSPSDEITREVGDEGTRASFTVENRCAEPVVLDRAELRFGDVGFRLTTPPDSVPANGKAELTVLFPANTTTDELADIVLVEASTATGQARYALGVWARPADE